MNLLWLSEPTLNSTALADNATAAADLNWDETNIAEIADTFDINVGEWGVDIDIASPDDFDDQFSLPDGEKGLATMNFTLANVQADTIKEALDMARDEVTPADTFGNENSNGNALYKIVKEWVEQRK